LDLDWIDSNLFFNSKLVGSVSLLSFVLAEFIVYRALAALSFFPELVCL